MFINIIISSKNKNSLKTYLNFLKNFSKNKKLHLNRTLVFLQKKMYKKIFTILKSPHVNKTAQEQLEFRLFTKNLRFSTFQTLKILIVLKKIQTIIFSEIQLKINFYLNLKQKKNVFVKKFNPNNIKLNFKLQYDIKQTELYFHLINSYGKYKFIKTCLNSSAGRAKD